MAFDTHCASIKIESGLLKDMLGIWEEAKAVQNRQWKNVDKTALLANMIKYFTQIGTKERLGYGTELPQVNGRDSME